MNVLLCDDIKLEKLTALLNTYNINVKVVGCNENIPGSFWQPPEAGLIDNNLYIRPDTPVHSALHEACHYICMDNKRRSKLNTDAGGDYEEEDAVCYLQIVLADILPEMGRTRMFDDMNEWGYSFRLGSSRDWFEKDAEDAKSWLLNRRIITESGLPTWLLRQD